MPPNEQFDGHKLISLEMELKKRYTECRRRTQKHYTASPKNDPHFQKAAEKVLSLGVGAMKWIDAQFELWDGEGFPQPSNLYCEAAVQRFADHVQSDRCPVQDELQCQKDYLTNYMKKVRMTMDEALLANWTNFRSYFRVLFCSEEALPRARQKFGKSALEQMSSDAPMREYFAANQPLRLERLFPKAAPDNLGSCQPVEEELPAATPTSESWENKPCVSSCQ